MVAGENGEAVEHYEPDNYEEENDDEEYRPCRGVSAAEEVSPVAAVGGGEPVVLQDYHYEEPLWEVSALRDAEDGRERLTRTIFRRRREV